MRLRAINQGIASADALGICLRSAVTHRGYDYSAFADATEGDYPWGDSNKAGKAMDWLRMATIDEAIAAQLEAWGPELVWSAKRGTSEEEAATKLEEQEAAWKTLIAERLRYSRRRRGLRR